MSSTTVEQIKEFLAPVADKIGQGAQFGWDVVVRQQFIEGISSIFWAFPLAMVAIACWWSSFKYAEESEGGTLLLIAPALVLMIWAFYNIDDGVLHLLNPDYYAMQFFVDLVHPASN